MPYVKDESRRIYAPRRKDPVQPKCCPSCKQTKELKHFHLSSRRFDGHDAYCKECKKRNNAKYQDLNRKEERRKELIAEKQSVEPVAFRLKNLLSRCKNRAWSRSIAFDIDLEYLLSLAPTHCPVLGIELDYKATIKFMDRAPTLDRLIPAQGYTKGNVFIISWRANRIKCDATTEEIQAVAAWVTKLTKSNVKIAA